MGVLQIHCFDKNTPIETMEALHDLVNVALAWSIQKGNNPIIGFSKNEMIDEAWEIRGKTLTEEEMKYLEEPYQPKNISGHS